MERRPARASSQKVNRRPTTGWGAPPQGVEGSAGGVAAGDVAVSCVVVTADFWAAAGDSAGTRGSVVSCGGGGPGSGVIVRGAVG